MQMTGLRLKCFFKTGKKKKVAMSCMGMSAERIFNNRGTWKSTQCLHMGGESQVLGQSNQFSSITQLGELQVSNQSGIFPH